MLNLLWFWFLCNFFFIRLRCRKGEKRCHWCYGSWGILFQFLGFSNFHKLQFFSRFILLFVHYILVFEVGSVTAMIFWFLRFSICSKIPFVMLNYALHLLQVALGTSKKNRLASGLYMHCSLTFSCELGDEKHVFFVSYLWLLVLVANANALKLRCELIKSLVIGQEFYFYRIGRGCAACRYNRWSWGNGQDWSYSFREDSSTTSFRFLRYDWEQLTVKYLKINSDFMQGFSEDHSTSLSLFVLSHGICYNVVIIVHVNNIIKMPYVLFGYCLWKFPFI